MTVQVDFTFSLQVAAWPSSSKAMTTTAAPWRLTMRALCLKASSPSLSEMELTMHLPWHDFRPASTMWNCRGKHRKLQENFQEASGGIS